MGRLIEPKVYLLGYTAIDQDGLATYLQDSGNGEFAESVRAAKSAGLSDGEVLCSLYAKLCYRALVLGKNDNITRIRDIPDNIRGTIGQGHMSVFEHCVINFVVTDCSRVFTHELVRHRAGTAFSQTSGRYVRGSSVDLVFDPILDPVRADIENLLHTIEDSYGSMVAKLGLDTMTDFTLKKKITSALRRVLPNGQSNEIGFSVNLRALRHTVELRTSPHAEWEIRHVFGQIYRLVKDKFPLLFHDAAEGEADGLLVVSGMKHQPY